MDVNARLKQPLDGRVQQISSFDGTRIHVETFGPTDAQTVILVHGWTQAIDYWRLQIEELRNEFHVVCYDARGHGQSERPITGDVSVDALAADMDAVIEFAGSFGGVKPVICGHSMGGITFMRWAQLNGDRVAEKISGVGLFSTGAADIVGRIGLVPGGTTFGTASRLVAGVFIGMPLRIPPIAKPIVRSALKLVAYDAQANDLAVAQAAHNVINTSAYARAGAARRLMHVDVIGGCKQIHVPSIVLVGERDLITPPGQSRLFSRFLPQLQALIEVPQVGHMTSHECPEITVKAIRDLLRLAANAEQSPVVKLASVAS